MKTERTRRTIEVTVEKSETFLVRVLPRTFPAWCHSCMCVVEISSPSHASRLAAVSTRRIYSGIEAGKVHFTELPDGTLLICMASLNAILAGSADAADDSTDTGEITKLK